VQLLPDRRQYPRHVATEVVYARYLPGGDPGDLLDHLVGDGGLPTCGGDGGVVPQPVHHVAGPVQYLVHSGRWGNVLGRTGHGGGGADRRRRLGYGSRRPGSEISHGSGAYRRRTPAGTRHPVSRALPTPRSTGSSRPYPTVTSETSNEVMPTRIADRRAVRGPPRTGRPTRPPPGTRAPAARYLRAGKPTGRGECRARSPRSPRRPAPPAAAAARRARPATNGACRSRPARPRCPRPSRPPPGPPAAATPPAPARPARACPGCRGRWRRRRPGRPCSPRT